MQRIWEEAIQVTKYVPFSRTVTVTLLRSWSEVNDVTGAV